MKTYTLIACLLVAGCVEEKTERPRFRIDYLHAQPGGIDFLPDSVVPTFDVSSEFGIGKGAIELLEGEWPAESIIRLHTKGLEGFTLVVGDVIHEKTDLGVETVETEAEAYFEISIPNTLLPAGTKRIEFRWVDFYR